ncbi:hypothetical protein IWQ56_000371 [Coemansia nantahalensis]|nr:hypothetical protein IWQ56_000371 [Coemansia nantahalensis]
MEPTYCGYIATTDDALLVFEACRLGILHRRTCRLSNSERSSIAPGCVFVWDETESGIRRWTDGRRWSPSRVNGCFLIYAELEPRSSEQHPPPGTDCGDGIAQQPRVPCAVSDTPLDSGLCKKTLSLLTTQGGKLHLVCYYRKTDADAGRLATPSHDPYLRGIAIPRSLYPDILPEMTQPLAPHALPAARRRRLSGAPANILVRGCTSMQVTQGSGLPSPSPAALATPAGEYHHRQCASLPLAGEPAVACRRRYSTTADFMAVAMHRHRVAPTPSVQTVSVPSPVEGPATPAAAPWHRAVGSAQVPWPLPVPSSVPPLSSYGPSSVDSPTTHGTGGDVTPLHSSYGRASSSSTRRSSTLVGPDPAYTSYPADNAGGGGGGEGRIQLPPISELLKLIDRPRPPPPSTPVLATGGAVAHKLSSVSSHDAIRGWNASNLAAMPSAHY